MRNTLTALMALFAVMTHAQTDTMRMSLAEAQEYAIQNSFASKSAKIDVAQAKKQVWEQAAKGLPQVHGNVGYTGFINLPTSIIPAGAFGNPEPIATQFGQTNVMKAGFTATQLIFDGSYIIGLKGAKGVERLRQSQGQMVEQDMRTMIEETYYTALVARANTDMLKQNMVPVQRSLKETTALFLNGMTEEMNVDQLQLVANGLNTQWDMADRQARNAIDLLKFQMGLPQETALVLTDDMDAIWQSSDPEALLKQEFEVENNVAYNMNKQDVVMHGYLVKLQEARMYPSLSAMFNHEQQAFRNKWNFFDTKQSWYPQTIWGISLNVPIWDNLGTRASIQKAKLEQQRVRDRLTYVEEGLKLKFRTSKDNFISSMEMMEQKKSDLDLATKIRDKTLIKYSEGVASSMELTTVENQLLAAQTAYINAMFSVLDAKADLNNVLTAKP